LTSDEINEKLDKIIASGANNIGIIMKEFANLPVDKKIVSELAKQKLNN
jgi:helix-turn-helix protein